MVTFIEEALASSVCSLIHYISSGLWVPIAFAYLIPSACASGNSAPIFHRKPHLLTCNSWDLNLIHSNRFGNGRVTQ